jgi:hypothetical protein
MKRKNLLPLSLGLAELALLNKSDPPTVAECYLRVRKGWVEIKCAVPIVLGFFRSAHTVKNAPTVVKGLWCFGTEAYGLVDGFKRFV